MAKSPTKTERKIPTPAELRASSEYREALDAEAENGEDDGLPEFTPEDPYFSFLWVRVELKGKEDTENISATMGGRLKYVPVAIEDIIESQRPRAAMLMKKSSTSHEGVIRNRDTILMKTRTAARLAVFDAQAQRRKDIMSSFKKGLARKYDGESVVRDYSDKTELRTEDVD